MIDKGLPALIGSALTATVLFFASLAGVLPDAHNVTRGVGFSPAPGASQCPSGFTELTAPTGDAAQIQEHTANFATTLTRICDSPTSILRRYDGSRGVTWTEQNKATGNTIDRPDLH